MLKNQIQIGLKYFSEHSLFDTSATPFNTLILLQYQIFLNYNHRSTKTIKPVRRKSPNLITTKKNPLFPLTSQIAMFSSDWKLNECKL